MAGDELLSAFKTAQNPYLKGIGSEHSRRKPIDLATKKLIEALECVTNRYESAHERSDRPSDLAKGCTHGIYVACSKALAEFRASLEDGE